MADTKISALASGNPAQSGDELPIARSGANYKVTAGSIAALAVPPGAITSSGLTMATARILGRTTASTGAIEEINPTTWFTLSSGILVPKPRGALVKKSTNQTTANYTSNTAMSWDAESYDTDSIHSDYVSVVTITIASPGVVTWNAHSLTAGSPVVFTTTGALPTGLTAGTIYYVLSPTANTFTVAAIPGGSAINTTGSQSGVHTGTNNSRLTVPAGVSKVRLSAAVRAESVLANDFCILVVNKNGSASWDGVAQQSVEINGFNVNVSCWSAPVDVSPGDFFEAMFNVASDTSITINASRSWFAMELLG